MSSKSCSKTKDENEQTKSPKQKENRDWKVVEIDTTQKTHPITKSSVGKGTKICVRITLTFCACGVVLGFCLMVAGGVGRKHLEDIQVLMYIGIILFLVCVILLVIMCSSYGIFHMNPKLEQTRQKSQCVCNIPIFNSDCANHVVFPYPICPETQKQMNQPLHHCCQPYHLKENEKQIVMHPTVLLQNDVTNVNKKEMSLCTVKNCVCLTKPFDDRYLTGMHQTEHCNNIPFRYSNERNPNRFSLCYHYNHVQMNGNHAYNIQMNHNRRNQVVTHGIGGNRVSSTFKEDYPMHNQSSNHCKGLISQDHKGAKLEKSEESSRL